MTTYIEILNPIDDINVSVNAELVIRIYSDDLTYLYPASIRIDVDEGLGSVNIFDSGSFQNGWTGNIINVDQIDNDDFIISCVRPDSSPNYTEDSLIVVDANYNWTVFEQFKFRIGGAGVIWPVEYDEDLDLSGPGAPAGWSSITTGTGLSPTFNGTMTPRPGLTGSSYIKKTSYGLNFIDGFIIDIEMELDTTDPNTIASRTTMIDVYLGIFGRIQVGIDKRLEPEISIITVVNTPVAGAGVPLFTSTTTNFRIRLAIKGPDHDNLVTKLYVGFDSDTNRSKTSWVLQQVFGPSTATGTIEDYISVGTVSQSTSAAIFKRISIKNGYDPELLYNKPIITSKSLVSGQSSGGDKLSLFGLNLDNDMIVPDFNDLTWIDDKSRGTGSQITASSGYLNLLVDGTTASNNDMPIAKFGIPLRSEAGGGVDISFDVELDSDLIKNLLGFNVTICGIEIHCNKLSFNLEFNNTSNGIIISALKKDSANLVHGTAGTILSERKLQNINTSIYNVRIILINGDISLLLNGQQMVIDRLLDLPTILIMYSKVAQPIDLNTRINNFSIKPIITFGSEVAKDIINTDNSNINLYTPEYIVGNQALNISNAYGNASGGNFKYEQDPQQLLLGGDNNSSIYIVDQIVKQPV